jgi:hypothetical protein
MTEPDELPPGMAEELDALAPGISSGELLAAIVTPGDHTPPPTGEWVLQTLRTLVEAEGETIGMVLAATDHQALMIPAPQGPSDPIKMLYIMRKTGALDSINWVACGADTYVRTLAGMSDGLGATEAFKAGKEDASEALMAICVAPDGPGYDYEQRYLRTPGGIVWEEPERLENGLSYGLVQMMQEVVLA